MLRATRRQFFLQAGLLSTAAAASPETVTAAPRQALDWAKLPRILIAEGFTPPFYPSFEYEAEKALSIARSLNADALRFPAAAYYAYFATKTEYPVHPGLRGDPLGRTIDLFHQAKLRVVTYVPLFHPFMESGSSVPVYQQWIKRFADGQPMTTDHYGYGPRYESCQNSPLRQVMLQFVHELLERYPIDVIYFDGPYQGLSTWERICYCRHCREAYQTARGKALPGDDQRLTREQEIEYFTWLREDCAAAFMRQMRQTIRAVRDIPVFYNNGALLEKRTPASHAYSNVDGFMFEHARTPEQKLFNIGLGRSTGKTVWTYVGSYQQYNREHLRNQDVQGWFSSPVETRELLMDGETALVAGAGPLYWGLSRFFYMPEGPLSYESGRYVKEIFDFVQKHESLLRSLKPQPQAAVVVGTQTIDWYNGPYYDAVSFPNYFYGAASLLRDNGYQAQPVLDSELSVQSLSHFKLVYVPNAACLSDAQCRTLATYVENGGTLLATHLSSIADEFGRVRKDFGLAGLTRASALAVDPVEMPDLYLHMLHMAGRDEVPQDPQIVRFKAAEGTSVLAETIQRGRPGSLGPAVLARSHGKGQVIYIGSGLEAIYEETRMPSIRAFIGRLLAPALAAARTYELDFCPGLMPYLAASSDALVLHLLADVGNKERKFRAREAFLGLRNLKVRLRVPAGRNVRRVSLLRSGHALPWTLQEGWIAAEVPEVLVYDAVHVELT
jgi:hypothetical protein